MMDEKSQLLYDPKVFHRQITNARRAKVSSGGEVYMFETYIPDTSIFLFISGRG